MALRISSVVWITDVSFECHCLLSLFLDVKRPVASKYDMNCLCATSSQTFDRTGSSEIGLLLFGISWQISVFEYAYHFSYFLHSIALKVLWQWVGSRHKWTLTKGVIQFLCQFSDLSDGILFPRWKRIDWILLATVLSSLVKVLWEVEFLDTHIRIAFQRQLELFLLFWTSSAMKTFLAALISFLTFQHRVLYAYQTYGSLVFLATFFTDP